MMITELWCFFMGIVFSSLLFLVFQNISHYRAMKRIKDCDPVEEAWREWKKTYDSNN